MSGSQAPIRDAVPPTSVYGGEALGCLYTLIELGQGSLVTREAADRSECVRGALLAGLVGAIDGLLRLLLESRAAGMIALDGSFQLVVLGVQSCSERLGRLLSLAYLRFIRAQLTPEANGRYDVVGRSRLSRGLSGGSGPSSADDGCGTRRHRGSGASRARWC